MIENPQIAIIGSGPSGIYTAQFLLKKIPDCKIDILERLPTPYGLVQYGVAPDHQSAKAITRQFDRLFENKSLHFFGGVEVGNAIHLEELKKLYDIVIIASGLYGDRRLGIQGENLPGVLQSGRLTRWLNGYPNEELKPQSVGPHLVIIGNGNVAIDVARLMAKTDQDLINSTMDLARHALLGGGKVKTIDIIGRGVPEGCKSDPLILRELANIPHVHLTVEGNLTPDNEDSFPQIVKNRLKVLREINNIGKPTAPCQISIRFQLKPIEIIGDNSVKAVIFHDQNKNIREIPASAVVTAIGFCDAPDTVISRDRFRIKNEGALPYNLGENLYSVGWFRKGPTGTIPENRVDAKEVVEIIFRDIEQSLKNKAKEKKGLASEELEKLLKARRVHWFDFEQKEKISPNKTQNILC